jgi:tetratricopeptide (TPR) repeat protein
MASAGFLKQLRSVLREDDWQPVLSALRQDPLVWDALQDDMLCSKALEVCGNIPHAWNPARLGLLSLGYTFSEDALRATPGSQLEPDLAARLLSLSTDPQGASQDLASAMLAALLAHEAYHQSKQWQRALASVGEKHAALLPTVLACLLPIAPDPVILLDTFLTSNLFPEADERRRLLTHAILASPLDPEQRINLFVRVLSTLSNDEQLATLAWLEHNTLGSLASPVAAQLLGKGKGRDPEPLITQGEETHFDIDTVYTQAMLQKLSGKVDESKKTLSSALDQLKTRQERFLDALDTMDAPAKSQGTGDTAPLSSDDPAASPVLGAGGMIKQISAHIQAGELNNAVSLIRQGQSRYPDNPEFARLEAELARNSGKTTEAIDALQTAVMLNPEDISLRKTLAVTYEEQGAWKDALDERRSILKFYPEPPEQELLALAGTAIRARQLGVAETACQTVLELEPENGQANAIYGELLHARGDDEKALLHLTRATTLSPDLPAPWLVISRIYRDQGNETFSIDTLKAAAQVLPDSPEIQFALGENCLNNSSPSEALVYLRRAYKYDPSSPAIMLRLAENLATLGLFAEAARILVEARKVKTSDPDLARLHAKVLLGLGELDAALETILPALETGSERVEVFSLLSDILEAAIDEKNSLTQILAAHPALKRISKSLQTMLENAIAARPESLDLQMLAADLLVESGAPEEALNRYRSLLQKLPYKHPDLWRAQFGLGRIALTLGQLDSALVALREAAQMQPERSDILRALAETYRAANLPREALETSHAVVDLLAGDSESLLWQADLCLKLDHPAEAAGAIEKALALDPDRSDLVLMHTRTLLAAGDMEPAMARLDALTARSDLDPAILKSAAALYTALGDSSKKRTCLKKAVESTPVPDESMLSDLAKAYAGEGQAEEALGTVDRALAGNEDNEELVLLRCSLLDQLGQAGEAREYLVTLLNSSRTEGWSAGSLSRLHARLAELLRESGDTTGALKSAAQAQALDAGYQPIQHLTLQLQRGCLLTGMEALRIRIQATLEQEVTDPDYPLTLVEAALDCNLVDEAAQLSDLFSDAADPVRSAAVKARLDALADDRQDAFEHFEAALAIQDEPLTFNLKLSRLISMTGAALSLKLWRQAVEFSQAARELASREPLADLLTLKALIFDKEENELCDTLKIQVHRPEKLELAAGALQDLLGALPSPSENGQMSYWQARGAGLTESIVDKKALACPPELHPNEMAGSLFLMIAAGLITDVDHLMESNPMNSELLRYHAAAFLERDTAIAAADAALLLEKDPADPLALAFTAWAGQDQPFTAFEAIEKTLAIWNDEPEWHVFAAGLCQTLGNIQGRINHNLELIRLLPDSAEHQISAGTAYLDANQLEQAVQCLKRAALIEPRSKAAWMLLGQAHHQAGNRSDAIEALEHAIALDPDDTDPLILSGRIALAAETFDLAAMRARQVMEIAPEESEGLLLLTGTLAKQGKQAEALETLEEAPLTLRRKLPVLIEQLMLTQAIKGPKAILTQLETLGARHREDPQVLKALAECYSAIGQDEEAEQTAMTALQFNADDASLHYLAGKFQRAKGQVSQAIDHLSEAIRLDPTQVEAYLELAQAYTDSRQYEQAVRVYQQATIVCPGDHRPYFKAGMLLKEGADFAAAEVMLKQAATLAPGDMNIQGQLGALKALNFVHHTQDALTRS